MTAGFSMSPIDRLEVLGRLGFLVSVACGPSGRSPFQWSVTVRTREGRAFERPFAADSFAQAITIAELEIAKRGWLSEDGPCDRTT